LTTLIFLLFLKRPIGASSSPLGVSRTQILPYRQLTVASAFSSNRQEELVSELEMKNEAEPATEDFTDELSDEALDREGTRFCPPSEPQRCRAG
jgi:hypothetical protein